jgi:hypothetical protein
MPAPKPPPTPQLESQTKWKFGCEVLGGDSGSEISAPLEAGASPWIKEAQE